MKKPLTKRLKLFFGMGNFGYQVLLNVETAFFTIFLTDVVKFSTLIVGAITIIGSIVDFIIAPLSGAIIGSTKALKWGRIRSWLLIAPPMIVIFFLMQFSNFGNGIFSAIIITIGYIVAHALFNIAFTADVAIIAQIAPNNEERLLLGSRRMMYNNLGRMFNSYFAPVLLSLFTSIFMNEGYAYTALIILFSIIMCLSFWTDFVNTKGYENQFEKESLKIAKSENSRLGFKDLYKVFTERINILPLMVADLTSNVGSFLLPALAVYYYKYVALDPSLLKYHLVLTSLGGLIGAYMSGILFRNIYKKKALLFDYFMIASLLILSRIFAFNTFIFMAMQAIMQFFVGMSQPLEADLYMDTAVYYEWKTGKDVTSFIMGLVNIPVKISVILKSIIITLTFLIVGYTPDASITQTVQLGIVNAYIVPAIIPIIGACSLGFFYKLKPDTVKSMQSDILNRKTK